MGGLMRTWTACGVAGMVTAMLAACSTPLARPSPTTSHAGDASFHALAADDMAHYALPMGSTSSGAELLDHPAPVYPPAMLASCPAEVRLQVLLIVGTDGRVDDVRVSAAAATAPAFTDAVRSAVRNWQFEPLVISHWAADANDETHPVDTESKPFSLPYEFRFACHAGKSQVSSSSAAGD